MHVNYFYICLEKARKAQMLVDFAERLGTNEPLLIMDSKLQAWNIVTQQEWPQMAMMTRRLRIFQGMPVPQNLPPEVLQSKSQLSLSVMRASVRYLELGLPFVSQRSRFAYSLLTV
jgi:hypothetical protein